MTVVQVSVGPTHHSDGPTHHHLKALPRRPADPRYTVTRRQLDILRLIANGNTTTAIARRLGISYNTVTSQVASIHRKLRVSDRAQAVAVALRMGLLDMDDVVVPRELQLPHHPGRSPVTALPCPTPTKSRYATTAAADQAARHVQIPVGTIMRAYECQCGWWHLTRSTSAPAEPIPYEDLTPADGDEQLLAGVGHNLFADVVARDIHGRGPIEEALALRHPTNALRWKEALKAAWIASEKQMAARRGDTSAQAKEWRARAEQYRAALRVRRLEAKRRAHPYPRAQGQGLSPAEQVAVERARAAGRPRREQRRIAGDVAVKLLIAAHEDEFYGLFAAECERLGLPLTARDEARVQRGLGEAA